MRRARRQRRLQHLASLLAFVALPAALAGGCAAHGRPTAPASTAVVASAPPATATNPPRCPDPPLCERGGCSNYPFRATECATTDYGPARADVVLAPTNFLYCNGGSYALCFFSGPPTATGKPRERHDNRPLPCELGADSSVADCTCQVYTSGPYFVDINGILNLGAYQQAVLECGSSGARCQNLAACGKDGTGSHCAGLKVPSVCTYVANQDPDDPTGSLMPKADLVSTFSFAMHDDYLVGTTDCTTVEDPLYAGCMTAPCFFAPGAPQPPSDGDPIHCQCPTFAGPYQVGQFHQSCTIESDDGKSYVWSAAYNPNAGDGQ